MSLDREIWNKQAESDGNKNWNKIAYVDGIEYFQKRAIEELRKLEDPLYENSNQTTTKELLLEVLYIIENLKP